jgi:hypothetical protein
MSGNWINPLLGEWLSSLLRNAAATLAADLAVTFGVPGADGGPPAQAGRAKRGINLHLLTVAPAEQATTRAERRTESRLVLRYLVTTWAEQRDVADALLCSLAFCLLGTGASGPDGRSEVGVETTPPLDILKALDVPPRPALIIGLPLVHVDEPAPAKRVLYPPIVRAELAEALSGRLVGTNDMPIAAAQVECPALGLVTQTDPEGWFRFATLPVTLDGLTIRVRARGVVHTFQLSDMAADRTVTLQMTFGEEG